MAGGGAGNGASEASGTKDGRVDLYALLRVERTADAGAIRKAYFVMARKVHPDKCPGDPDAAKNFQTLQQAYEILKDPVKRKHYDRTGSVGNDETSSFWEAYEKYKTVEITEDDIKAYLAKFTGSKQEEDDLLAFFAGHKGNVTSILGFIIGSSDEDIPRFVEFFEKALADGKASEEFRAAFDASKRSIMTVQQLDEMDNEDEEDIGSASEGDEEQSGEGDESNEDDSDMEDFIVHEDGDAEAVDDAAINDDGSGAVEESSSEEEEDSSEDGEGSGELKFAVGDTVEARWRKGPRWYVGEVLEVSQRKRTYTIKYEDDGFTEKGVQEQHTRPPRKSGKRKSSARAEAAMEESHKAAKTETGRKRPQAKARAPQECGAEAEEDQEAEAEAEEAEPAPRKKTTTKRAAPRAKRAKKGKGGDVDMDYDGDLGALRAAMAARAGSRNSAFDEFAARWAGK